MFCPKCGAQIAEGARFCPRCGAAAPASAPQPAPMPAPDGGAPRRRGRRGPVLVGAAVGVVALLAVAAVVVLGVFGKGPAAGVVPSVAAPRLGNELANLTVGGGYVAPAGDYDYFVSYQAGGVCRAKVGSDDVEVVHPMRVDTDGYSMVRGLNVLDGWVYFVEDSYEYSGGSDSDHTVNVVRVREDGSDEEALYEVAPTDEDGGYVYVQSLFVYDDTCYLVIQHYNDALSRYTYDLVSFGTDGSDPEVLSTVTADGGCGFVVTTERVYYYCNPTSSGGSGAQAMGRICVQDLDGSNFEELYQSSYGTIYGFSLEDGRLVFSESNYGAGRMRVASLATDGSDERTLYESEPNDSASVGVYADGKAYLVVYENDSGYTETPSRIDVVPLSGEGDVESFEPSGDSMSTSLGAGAGHLVALGAGGDFASLGYRVEAVGYDGSELATYVD